MHDLVESAGEKNVGATTHDIEGEGLQKSRYRVYEMKHHLWNLNEAMSNGHTYV